MIFGLRASGALMLAGLVLLIYVASVARAAAGDLDPTYGKEGLALTPFGTAGVEANVQVSSTRNNSAVVANGLEGTVVRFRPDGSRDFGFGEPGRAYGWPRGCCRKAGRRGGSSHERSRSTVRTGFSCLACRPA